MNDNWIADQVRGPHILACAQKCVIPEGVVLAQVPPAPKLWPDVIRCPNDGCDRTFIVISKGSV